MQIATELNVIQNTPEWFDARKGLATASEMNSVFAKGKDGTSSSSAMRKNYRMRLALERITGQPVRTYKSASMEQGNELEATAALLYELKTGLSVRECGFFRHNTIDWGASPDRLVGNDGTLQIKCFEPTEHGEVLKKQAIPPKYERQCINELYLTNRDWLDFAAYNGDFPKNARLFVKRMYRNEYIQQFRIMQDAVVKFLQEVQEEVSFINDYQQ